MIAALNSRLRHLAARMPLGKDLVLGALPKALNGFTTLGLNLYAARFLEPAEFAIIGFATTCFMMADGILGSALDLAVAGRSGSLGDLRDDSPTSVERTSVFLKLNLGFCLLVLAMLMGEWLGWKIFHRPGGRNLFLLVSGAATGVLLIRSIQLFYQLRLRFKSSGALDLSISSLRVTAIIAVLAAGERSGMALLLVHALALAIIALLFGARFAIGLAGRDAPSGKALRELLRAAAPSLISYSVGSLVARLDLFLVAGRGNATEVGFYTAALTLMTIPEVVASYMAPVFLPRIARLRSSGAFGPFFKRILAVLLASMGTIWLLSLILHEPVFRLLFSRSFEASFRVQQVLLPGALASASIMPLTLNYLMMRSPRAFLVTDLMIGAALWLGGVTFANSLISLAVLSSGLRVVKAAIVHALAWRLASEEGADRR